MSAIARFSMKTGERLLSAAQLALSVGVIASAVNSLAKIGLLGDNMPYVTNSVPELRTWDSVNAAIVYGGPSFVARCISSNPIFGAGVVAVSVLTFANHQRLKEMGSETG